MDHRGFMQALLGGTVTCLLAASAFAEEPAALQQSAKDRMARYRDHLRKTGQERRDELSKAYEELDRAYRLYRDRGMSAEAAACRVLAGRTFGIQRQHERAIKLYADAATIARRAKSNGPLVEALSWDAVSRIGLNDIDGAEARAAEAARLATKLSNETIRFNAFAARGEVALARKELASSQYWLTEALAQKTSDHGSVLIAHIRRAQTNADLARQDGAVREFRLKMADLAIKDARRSRAIAQERDWAALIGQLDAFVRQIEYVKQVVELEAKDPTQNLELRQFDPRKRGDVFVSQEWLSVSSGMPAGFMELVRKYQTAKASEPTRAYVRAGVASQAGQEEEALEYYKEAVRLLDHYYRSLSDESARRSLIAPKIDYYYWPMMMLLQRRKYADAFELMEKSRARVLSDLILTKEKIALADADAQLLYRRLRQLRAKIEKQKATEGAVGAAFVELQKQHPKLLQEIRERDPALLELVTSEVASLDEIRAGASTGKYDILEYIVLPGGIGIWHIGPKGVHVRNVFLPHKRLQKKIDLLRQSLVDPNVEFDTTLAREMFLFFVEPMLSFLSTDRLVVIPHEELYYLPFQVFQDPANGQFLVEKFTISYAPSAGVLQRLKSAAKLGGGKILSVGGPGLEEAQVEAEAVAALYPGSRVVAGDKATIATVRRLCGAYDVLHIAAHGEFDHRKPLLSWIGLNPKDDDGKLTAAGMFALPLANTRLVSLAACETGRVGGIHAGELVGIPRALIYAGADAILLSHWRVDSDATQEWMGMFYRQARHLPLAEAARRASLALKSRTAQEHPYYWGAFYLVGK